MDQVAATAQLVSGHVFRVNRKRHLPKDIDKALAARG
jgi:hypothetical protein